ncbi:MAG: hypothetical protein JSR47_17605 [Proteobacteria bacterium]|nr:hypothetical protein [Pseudomonadota bacterium]MBS0548076.1 hypothetical protein [Pseudomonadota bacterium]
MIRKLLVTGAIALSASACAVEHRTEVVTPNDACARYGFTASTADYIRCQDMLAAQRRAGRVPAGYDAARITAASQAACESYGVPRGSANYDRCVQDEFAARRPG